MESRACSRAELARHLASRNVPDEVAADLLDRLERVGLLDDAALAKTAARVRRERSHEGKAMIRLRLARRGLGEDEIAQAVGEIDDDAELEAAVAAARKRARATRGCDPGVARRRIAGALARRGFGSDTIRTALRVVCEEEADG